MSGRRLARPSRPIFMPRLNAAFGSVCDRKPASATPPETNVCVLSERSPSRNAGRPQPPPRHVGHRGRAAEVDLALGQVGDELPEVLRREEQVPVRRGVVADDVVHGDAPPTLQLFELLREHNVAFVFADTAGKFPYAEDLTADFVYIRLHGAEKLYVSGYNDRALEWWGNRIKLWRKGRQPRDAKLVAGRKIDNRSRDVFVYFDNDAKVHAPFDATRLAKLLNITR